MVGKKKQKALTRSAYRVVCYREGCKRCLRGSSWVILDINGVQLPKVYCDILDANFEARQLCAAFAAGVKFAKEIEP